MAHRVPFHNKIALLVLLPYLWNCTQKKEEHKTSESQLQLNRSAVMIAYKNGLLQFDNKPFSGQLYTLFPGTKDTAEISSYHNGKEEGEWKKYYPSGKLKERRFFMNGKKSGDYFAWWENGNIQLHYFFSDGEYQGTCKEWNADGNLSKVMNYKNGYEEGQQQWWYDNGKIKANYIIKNGRRFGLLGTKNCINVSDSIFKK